MDDGVEQLRFDERVAIVTGAGRGIGREHALLLAKRGASVIVNDLGGEVAGGGFDAGPASEVVAEIIAAGGTAIADVNTVASPEGADGVVRTALKEFGRLDIVVNNAGIYFSKPFIEMSPDEFESVVRVNLFGTANVVRAAWTTMIGQRYGRVVNTASVSGYVGSPQAAHYSAAKMGVVGLTRALAHEGAEHGIRVNAIAPGGQTRMIANLDETTGAPLKSALGDGGFGQLRPEDAAPMMAWLAHESCSVTGELFSTLARRMALVFVSVADGYRNGDSSPEDVRDHMADILDTSQSTVPRTSGEELARIQHVWAR